MEKKLTYRLQFIDSKRFMKSLLSNLVNNLAEGIHKIKSTNCNTCCLEHTNDDLIEYKCSCCNKITQNICIKTQIRDLSICLNLPTMTSISLSCAGKKCLSR